MPHCARHHRPLRWKSPVAAPEQVGGGVQVRAAQLAVTLRRAGPALRRLAAQLALGLVIGLGPAAAAERADDPASMLATLDRAAWANTKSAASRLAAWVQTLAPNDPQRVPAMALCALVLSTRNETAAAAKLAEEIHAASGLDPRATVLAQLVRGAVTARTGPLTRADRLLSEALIGLGDDVPQLLRWRGKRLLAWVKQETGQFDQAVRLQQEALRLADQAGPLWHRAQSRSDLAYALHLGGQTERGMEINQEAMAIADQADDSLARTAAYNTLSLLLDSKGDLEAQRQAMERMIEEARRAGSKDDEVLGIANLSDLYLKKAEYPTAIKLARQALPLAREAGDVGTEAVAVGNIGLALISMHQLKDGLAHVRQAVSIHEAQGSLTTLASTLHEAAEYLEHAGYIADAVAMHREHRKLAEQLYDRDRQRAMLEVQEGFDTERRAKELALLQGENRLKATALERRTLIERLWIAGAVTAVLVLSASMLLIRRLRQHNRLLHEGNARLRTQAELDPLTCLPNRHHLQRVMQERTREHLPFEGSLLLVDLDHFKRINDHLGHAAGDAVLVEVAARLRSTLRDGDMVCRWGGEEFLVLTRAAAPEQTLALAQRLLQAIGGTPMAAGHSSVLAHGLTVTASIGCASFPIEPSLVPLTWEQALALVDTALYLAKAHGRNLAYDIRQLHAADAQSLAEISRSLEAAWAAGQVQLVASRGPVDGATLPDAASIETEPAR